MDLIVLLKVEPRRKKNLLPARRCFQHPAITLCKSWPGMLIHCYLKCIEFPCKMIHSCSLKLINNDEEPAWRLEYLHACSAPPCMQEHSPALLLTTARLQEGWLRVQAHDSPRRQDGGYARPEVTLPSLITWGAQEVRGPAGAGKSALLSLTCRSENSRF